MMTPEKTMKAYDLGAITELGVRHELIMYLLDHNVESVVTAVYDEFIVALKEWASKEDLPRRMVNLSQDPDDLAYAAYAAAKEKLRRYFAIGEPDEGS